MGGVGWGGGFRVNVNEDLKFLLKCKKKVQEVGGLGRGRVGFRGGPDG